MLVVFVSACTDFGLPGETTMSTSALLILPVQSSAPNPLAVFMTFRNDRTTTRQLLHPDAFNTPFLALTFRAGSLVSVGGTPLGSSDSLRVAVQPEPGVYGFSLSPNDAVFSQSVPPSVRLTYAQYGNLTVHSQSTQYANAIEYGNALRLWYEVTPGRWRRVSGSGPDGLDAVSGPIDQPGTYIVAAPR